MSRTDELTTRIEMMLASVRQGTAQLNESMQIPEPDPEPTDIDPEPLELDSGDALTLPEGMRVVSPSDPKDGERKPAQHQPVEGFTLLSSGGEP